jgi:hypothetical protein
MKKKGFIYMTVLTQIDQTGLMLPSEILWPDGRRFPIDKVIRWRKAQQYDLDTTRYDVIIKGQEKELYFRQSHSNIISPINIGRWFVEIDLE